MTARRTDPTVGLVKGQKYRKSFDTDIRLTFARIKREQAAAKARDAQADLPGIPQVVVPLVRGAK